MDSISTEQIKKLATLCRISVTDEEGEALRSDIASVLSYVEQIKDVAAGPVSGTALHRNVMREDGEPHESGIYTKNLLGAAPATKNGFIKVRKIIDQS